MRPLRGQGLGELAHGGRERRLRQARRQGRDLGKVIPASPPPGGGVRVRSWRSPVRRDCPLPGVRDGWILPPLLDLLHRLVPYLPCNLVDPSLGGGARCVGTHQALGCQSSGRLLHCRLDVLQARLVLPRARQVAAFKVLRGGLSGVP